MELNEGQKKFYQYMLDRVKPEECLNAEELMKEAFTKQADGTFDQEYLQKFMPQMMNLVKKEHHQEVKNIMQNFRPE